MVLAVGTDDTMAPLLASSAAAAAAVGVAPAPKAEATAATAGPATPSWGAVCGWTDDAGGSEEADEVVYARTLFDCREYMRAAHVLDTAYAEADLYPPKAFWLRCYALYLVRWGEGGQLLVAHTPLQEYFEHPIPPVCRTASDGRKASGQR